MLDREIVMHAVRPTSIFLKESDSYLSHNFQCNSFLLSSRIYHVSDLLPLTRKKPLLVLLKTAEIPPC